MNEKFKKTQKKTKINKNKKLNRVPCILRICILQYRVCRSIRFGSRFVESFELVETVGCAPQVVMQRRARTPERREESAVDTGYVWSDQPATLLTISRRRKWERSAPLCLEASIYTGSFLFFHTHFFYSLVSQWKSISFQRGRCYIFRLFFRIPIFSSFYLASSSYTITRLKKWKWNRQTEKKEKKKHSETISVTGQGQVGAVVKSGSRLWHDPLDVAH